MSEVLIKGMEMPKCCDECFALDEHGDYPYCLISKEQRGYTFRTREKRMPNCPLTEEKIETSVFDKEEIYENCTVQVLTNTVTGEVSVGWWKDGE